MVATEIRRWSPVAPTRFQAPLVNPLKRRIGVPRWRMGKDYSKEMDLLEKSYYASLQQPYSKADVACWRALGAGPLVTIGIGGSMAAGELACLLHRRLLGLPARSASTLRAIEEGALGNEAALLVSAGGKNKDILTAFARTLAQRPRDIFILTANEDSPLAVKAREADYPITLATRGVPSKDGFLATNTLLAAFVHLFRVYAEATGKPCILSPSFKQATGGSLESLRHEVTSKVKSASGRPTFLLLYGAAASPAAIDLEARINESGLGVAHLADLRSFAHGRHYWLHHHADNTAIIALLDDESEGLGHDTLKLVPKHIPSAIFQAKTTGLAGALELLVTSMLICEALGKDRDHNPGQPHVPTWGRRLYRLGPKSKAKKPADKTPVLRNVGAIVLDVDGTLLERRERFGTIRNELAQQLRRLSNEGTWIGFATGRGKSLHREVLAGVFDQKQAERVILGYYNGTVVKRLSSTSDDLQQQDVELRRFEHHLKKFEDRIPHTIESKGTQVNYSAKNAGQNQDLADLIRSQILTHGYGLNVGTSTLGIDVFSAGRGKLSVVDEIAKLAGMEPDDVVRIGDCGYWGGNDQDLLNHPKGYRVGIAPIYAGDRNYVGRGPLATLRLLKSMTGPGRKSG